MNTTARGNYIRFRVALAVGTLDKKNATVLRSWGALTTVRLAGGLYCTPVILANETTAWKSHPASNKKRAQLRNPSSYYFSTGVFDLVFLCSHGTLGPSTENRAKTRNPPEETVFGTVAAVGVGAAVVAVVVCLFVFFPAPESERKPLSTLISQVVVVVGAAVAAVGAAVTVLAIAHHRRHKTGPITFRKQYRTFDRSHR